MKKFITFVMAICLATGAFAQGFGQHAIGINEIEIGDRFDFEVINYLHFGFNGIIKNETVSSKTGFFRSQQFGFNMLEFGFLPYEDGKISLGADVEWNWYHLNKDYVWVPLSDGSSQSYTAGGSILGILPKDLVGVSEVKRSIFSVCTFGFPVNFTHHFGKMALQVGVTPELNLNGYVQFRGLNLAGENVNDMRSGARFSKNIKTNLFTWNAHAAISYGGLGLYFKYSPKNVLQQNYGPQFNTFTVGLILGLGM